jgi:2-polyprenyl-3-methyl-5-hydroxy-6-metoxy-1,4-benzoquinol methylase
MNLEMLTTCPLCGSAALTKLIQSKDYTLTGETFNIDRCKICDFAFTNPRPAVENLGKYYETEKYISHSNKSKSLFDRIYFIARNINLNNKKNLIEQYKKVGNVLDFGCGTGAFLKYLSDKGWNSYGVEPSETARSIASQEHNISVYDSLEKVPSIPFDVITLWHVMEHIPDFVDNAKKLRTLLKKDGILVIAVPNHESPDAIKYGSAWAGYDVPRHLSHFSKSTMKKLLINSSLRLISTIPLRLDAYYVSLLSQTYLHPNQNKLISSAYAFIAGLSSNWKAKKNLNHSSLIYIAQAE